MKVSQSKLNTVCFNEVSDLSYNNIVKDINSTSNMMKNQFEMICNLINLFRDFNIKQNSCEINRSQSIIKILRKNLVTVVLCNINIDDDFVYYNFPIYKRRKIVFIKQFSSLITYNIDLNIFRIRDKIYDLNDLNNIVI